MNKVDCVIHEHKTIEVSLKSHDNSLCSFLDKTCLLDTFVESSQNKNSLLRDSDRVFYFNEERVGKVIWRILFACKLCSSFKNYATPHLSFASAFFAESLLNLFVFSIETFLLFLYWSETIWLSPAAVVHRKPIDWNPWRIFCVCSHFVFDVRLMIFCYSGCGFRYLVSSRVLCSALFACVMRWNLLRSSKTIVGDT